MENNECTNTCPNCQHIRSFNRLNYDTCSYNKKLQESTSPLSYQMSRFKFENCSRCTYNGKHYAPFDLVDEESNLKGITQQKTKCPSKLYNPSCIKSNSCWSTYDMPIVYPANLCPIVWNDMKKMNAPGYILQENNF